MSSGSEDDRAAAEAAAIFDAVLDPERGKRTISPAQIEADGGLTVDQTRLVVLNFGLPAPDPEDPYFTAAEADVLVHFGRLREIGRRRSTCRSSASMVRRSPTSLGPRSTCFGSMSSRNCGA